VIVICVFSQAFCWNLCAKVCDWVYHFTYMFFHIHLHSLQVFILHKFCFPFVFISCKHDMVVSYDVVGSSFFLCLEKLTAISAMTFGMPL